jgi:hypothetical protein
VWAVWFALTGMDLIFGAMLRTSYGDWWAEYWQYSANYALVVWVPQHMLPGWLATSIIVNELETEADLSFVGFAAALTGLWSPFVTIGLAPVVAVAFMKGRWRTLFTFANLVAGPAILLIAALYLKTVERDKFPSGVIFDFYPWQSLVLRWPFFCLCEFGLYALLIAPEVVRHRNAPDRRARMSVVWFVTAIVALIVIPTYRIGEWNDFCMRASIPCLFLFWIVLLRTLFSGELRLNSWRGNVLLACLFVSAAFPGKNWVYQVTHSRPGLHYFWDNPDVSVTDLHTGIIPQYLGNADSFFFCRLAPPLSQEKQP